MKPVPLLARIRVATPCRADWNEMTGDERVRHCAHCNKNVFNLSSMTREQAERLIIEKNGDLCARYYQRTDGTILLADCSVGVAQKRKTRVLAASAAMLLAGTGGAGAYLKLSHEVVAPAPDPTVGRMAVVQPQPPPPEVHEVKGDIGIEPPTEVMQGGISMSEHVENKDGSPPSHEYQVPIPEPMRPWKRKPKAR